LWQREARNRLEAGARRGVLLDFFVCLFKTGFSYVAQASLKLLVLLTEPPKSWNYRYATPVPADLVFKLGEMIAGLNAVFVYSDCYNKIS
jgi:hypothetical protein